MNPQTLNPHVALWPRWLRIATIALATVAIDQITKAMAKAWLPNRRISLLGDLIRLQPSQNAGAFMSLGARLPETARFWLFIVISSVILLLLAVFVVVDPTLTPMMVHALSLVLGGGIGNMIDRMRFNGRVFDFLNVGIGGVRTGIFNVADVAIMAGGILALWAMMKVESYRSEAVS
jgi:signal peptidase II